MRDGLMTPVAPFSATEEVTPGGIGGAGAGAPPVDDPADPTLDESLWLATQHGHDMVEDRASRSDNIHVYRCQHAGCRAIFVLDSSHGTTHAENGLDAPCP